MTEHIHKAAEADVPPEVQVPTGPAGWAWWLAARFGGMGILAAATLYGLNRVYEDSRADSAETRELYKQAVKVQGETVESIRASTDQLRRVEDGVKEVRTQMEISNKNNHP